MTGIDRPEFVSGSTAFHEGMVTQERRETLVRAQLESLLSVLPPGFHECVAVGLGEEKPAAVIENVIPALTPLLLKAERTALSAATSGSFRPIPRGEAGFADRPARAVAVGEFEIAR